MAIAHHHLDVRAGVGKRRKSVSKNSGPILNLFSPQDDLFHSHCHIESSLLSQESDGEILLRTDMGCKLRHGVDALTGLY
jgi:hypothetical protein